MAGRPQANDADWTRIDPTPRDRSEVPDIPSWVDVEPGTPGESWYYQVSMLPQARLWNEGTISQLWLTLPLVNKYFERPGSEGLKAIASLNAALLLTEDDMRKARVKFKTAEELAASGGTVSASPSSPGSISDENVAFIEKKRNDRRSRLTGT